MGIIVHIILTQAVYEVGSPLARRGAISFSITSRTLTLFVFFASKSVSYNSINKYKHPESEYEYTLIACAIKVRNLMMLIEALYSIVPRRSICTGHSI